MNEMFENSEAPPSKPSTKLLGSRRWIVTSAVIGLIGLAGIGYFLLSSDLPARLDARPSESALRQDIQTMERLAINRDWRELYDRYIHESEKQKVSYQEFVEINGNPGYTVRDITIESIALDGESAIATLITTRCYSSDCDGPNQKMVRRRLRFEYINGRWYRPMNILVYCTRSEPYPIVPEFERAISLIEQR